MIETFNKLRTSLKTGVTCSYTSHCVTVI